MSSDAQGKAATPNKIYDDQGVDATPAETGAAIIMEDEAMDVLEHKMITATFNEASVRARRKKVKQSLSLQQEEKWHVLSIAGGVQLPFLECSEFPGQTNDGGLPGSFRLLPHDEEWQIDVASKRTIYGDWRINVGGKNPSPDARKPSDHDVEPAFS